MKCCNTEIEIKKGKQNGKDLFYAECPVCHKKHKAETEKEVQNFFTVAKQEEPPIQSYQLPSIPKKPADIITWGNSNLPALMRQSAQFIDKPATQRMIEKNLRYVANLTGKAWDKVWGTIEGQESISNAMIEANYYAATLGEMGDIVPFGGMCEFIASIECYRFSLETGRGAPFRDIQIDLIHENDQTDNYQKDGNFFIEIKRGIPRGEIIAVVVSGIRTDNGKRIGEIYDVERLIAKAEQHSPSYKNYLIEKSEFKRLQIEGKLKKEADGRLYYEKQIPKADGGTWNKKVYESDITNPYDGPDRPEMLRKAAGKSFFRPYMKTRNASAMAEEWQDEAPETREQTADSVLNKAMGQFKYSDAPYNKEVVDKIKDGEIITEVEVKKATSDNKTVEKSDKLFSDEGEL